jgi:acyl-CoA thioesterase
MATKLDVIEGKKPISWKRLMALKPVGNDTFESLTAAWPPAPFKRTFGGHVYAQAVYAASKTVGEGLVVHVCAWNPFSEKHPVLMSVPSKSRDISSFQAALIHHLYTASAGFGMEGSTV